VVTALLFALTYAILRAVLDNFLPSNVRYPVALDKGGAAVMGIVAGVLASGTLGVIAQQLPFGASAVGYSPYELEDSELNANRRLAPTFYKTERGGSTVIETKNVMAVDQIGIEDEREGLWLPVDQWVLGLVDQVSGSGGSLEGPADFAAVYPGGAAGYVDALYGRRIGRQLSAQNVAVVNEERQDVKLADNGGLFQFNTDEGTQFGGGILQVAGEDWQDVRGRVDETYRVPNGKRGLVLRLRFGDDAGDGYTRFGTGNVRLVAGGEQYFPIGTLEGARVLARHSPDDRLLARTGVDLVFEVDPDVLTGDPTRMTEGAFVEFKETARLPLGERRVFAWVTETARSDVLRKETAARRIAVALGGDDRDRSAFEALREALPAQAESAEAAEQAYLEGQAEQAELDIPEGTGDALEEPEVEVEADDGAGDGFIGRNIAPGARERNDQIEGE
jgi:hypothetical protein